MWRATAAIVVFAACRDRPQELQPAPVTAASRPAVDASIDTPAGWAQLVPSDGRNRGVGLGLRSPAMSRDQARRQLDTLPEIRAVHGRLVDERDATDIVSCTAGSCMEGCTGSAAECMYWFRVDRQGAFWRYFAIDPTDPNRIFTTATPDLDRARHGALVPRQSGVGGGTGGGS